MKLFVILPAYNEEESLPNLLPKLKCTLDELALIYEIIVCDDGSVDRTAETFHESAGGMSATLFRHAINRGLGETMRDL